MQKIVTITSTVALAAATLLTVVAAVPARAEQAAKAATAGPGLTANPFDLSDRNTDGRVDREEFQRRQTDVFYFEDGNKDGVLVIEEIDVPAPAFKAADADKSGKLSLPEYLNDRFKDYDAADANRDGTLSPGEVAGK
jgi:hypothetical protein